MTNVASIFLPHLKGGGMERIALNLAKGLSENGVDVDVVVTSRKGEFVDSFPSSVRVTELLASGRLRAFLAILKHFGGAPRERLKAARTLRARPTGRVAPSLADYINTRRPNAILAMSHANLIAVVARSMRRRNQPRNQPRHQPRLVLSEHNTRLDPAFTPFMQSIGETYKKADAIVAVSEGVADQVAPLLGIRREAFSVIYNPVATPDIADKAEAPSPHPWLDEEIPVILGAGRLCEQKDFSTLLRAFAEMRSRRRCRLIILGDGPQRGKLETLANDLNVADDIRLHGFTDNPFAWMSRADVFALSSKWEGFGNVIVEALACGCNVVATDCRSGPREILADGQFGELVHVEDPHALAQALERAINKPTPKETLRKRADEFSPKQIMPRYMKLLFPQQTKTTTTTENQTS